VLKKIFKFAFDNIGVAPSNVLPFLIHTLSVEGGGVMFSCEQFIQYSSAAL